MLPSREMSIASISRSRSRSDGDRGGSIVGGMTWEYPRFVENAAR
jgi:hypothetical protein